MHARRKDTFDKGNNSKANMEELDRTPYHIVGSLVPSQHEELLEVPLDRFRRLPARFGKTWVYRTTKQVFSRDWTVVVTRSQRLLNGQVRGIRQHLRKKLKCLEELKVKLARSQGSERHGKPYTRSSLETHINQIVSGQYIKGILHIRIHGQNGKLSLSHRVDRKSFRRLRQTVLGKRILFTDHEEWTDEQIVDAYRGQHHVERAFRDMKGGELIHFSPSFHWTDSKLLVHGLCCVLGLVLLGLVHRKVINGAIDISREQLMRELKEIGEVVNLYPPSGSSETRRAGRPRASRTLTRRTDLQKQLCDVLKLDQLASS